ncbi:MAG: hypothetical protein HYR60_04915 [Acidobacteria bacterium]|nr:hypothetical protein [Acidobacteriota bacterium]
MMTAFSPREIQFRDELRDWLARNLPKNWKQEHAALGAMEEKFAYLRRWQKKLTRAIESSNSTPE